MGEGGGEEEKERRREKREKRDLEPSCLSFFISTGVREINNRVFVDQFFHGRKEGLWKKKERRKKGDERGLG